MALRTVIFDFDGTLHDCMYLYRPAFAEALAWLRKQGIDTPPVDEARLRSFIGMTVNEMWNDYLPDADHELCMRAARMVGDHMEERMADGRGRLIDGVEEMLDRIGACSVNMVFLSNCGPDYLDVARSGFDLDRWFDERSGYFCSGLYGGIPKCDIFGHVAAVNEGDYLMIGDRASDLEVAWRNGDFPTIGCTFGYAAAGELDKATYLADTPQQVADLVEKLTC